jgi:hypothetical protein
LTLLPDRILIQIAPGVIEATAQGWFLDLGLREAHFIYQKDKKGLTRGTNAKAVIFKIRFLSIAWDSWLIKVEN